MKGEVTISGGGLVGSLFALFLEKKGYKITVYEKRSGSGSGQQDGGRSINLAISNRGLKALEQVGLKEKALEMAIPMYGRMIHDKYGKQRFLPYGKEGQFINSISRSALNDLMIKTAAPKKNISYHFETEIKELDQDEQFVSLSTGKRVKYEILVGADGAFSKIREGLKKTGAKVSLDFLDYGYKELTMPAGKRGRHLIRKNVLHIWPRSNFMLIALPNKDGSFTCTLFLPLKGTVSFENIDHEKSEGFFREEFPDVLDLLPALKEDFKNNPTGKLVTVRCSPWSNPRKNIVLIGDAAHAIVPFYGQGMNAGFEDCRLFAEKLKEKSKWVEAIEEYEENRIPNANAIADLALMNFKEMRDLVAREDFQKLKEAETLIEERYKEYQSLYELVTFSDIPYSKAKELGLKRRKVILSWISKGIEPGSELFWEKVREEFSF